MTPTPPRKPARPTKPARPQRPRKPEKRSDKTPDPLADVEYTGNIEEDAARELTALEQAYRERAANEANRFYAATDSEYWACVCFRSREEREAFMRAIGEDPDTKYITGDRLKDLTGIEY